MSENNAIINSFSAFINDNEPEFYLTGAAGTGKTTLVIQLIKKALGAGLSIHCVAYTHKAVKILKTTFKGEVPEDSCSTLHSFLAKRPTINTDALNTKEVEGNTAGDVSEFKGILFVDEFSMVGEKDYTNLTDAQYDSEGNLLFRVVYVGDLNQLPPVKDQQTIFPNGKYKHHLTKVYRQANDNKLTDTLIALTSYIEGQAPQPLLEHETFVRNENIVQRYMQTKTHDKIILAYTNAKVQELNAQIQGREAPILKDDIYCSTLRKIYTYVGALKNPDFIVNIGGDIIDRTDKFNTLETIEDLPDVEFYNLIDADGNETIHAGIFGHANYNNINEQLKNAAVRANKEIMKVAGPDVKPKVWGFNNRNNPLEIERKKAWREYLAFKSNVMCFDFAHAMTVHKSQGSTYEVVCLDTEDMYKCAKWNFNMYLKLMYVAISRASSIVYTN